MISGNEYFMLKIQTCKPLYEISDFSQIALEGNIPAVNDNITRRNINRMMIAMCIGQGHNNHAVKLAVCTD
jgi:hypothetical protein